MTLSPSNPRAKPRWLALFAIVVMSSLMAGSVALANHGATPTPNPVPSNYVFVVEDQQGANDVPGQVDLTQMARDDTTAGVYKLFWSWDSISAWTGQGQTGDACALFDSDNDGFINFVVCTRVSNPGADPTDVEVSGVFAFACSDKKNDRCTNPSPTNFTSDQIQYGALGTSPLDATGNLITHTDPFGPAAVNGPGESYPSDSTIEIHINTSLIQGTEVLVNVCSYPSAGNGGNNNPFDCIVNPGGGFLVVTKDAGAVTSPNFTFDIHTVQGGTATFVDNRTIAGSGSAVAEPLLIGNNVRVTETAINSAWELTAIACTKQGGGATGTASLANSWITGVEILSGQITTCTFTDRERVGSLTLAKTVVNDDGGTAVARDFTLSATGSSRSFSLAAGSSATSLTGNTGAQTVTPNVQYTLSESGPAGYSPSAWTCTGTGVTQGTGADANKVTIAAGGAGTCSITNNDNGPTLTLAKTVVNDDGGTSVARDFTLSATGNSRSFSLAAGSSATSLTGNTGAQPVTAGVQYSLSESGPAGYSPSAWTCTGTGVTQGTGADANKVTIALGGAGTCSITNNDNGPTLTLAKIVTNNNGGTSVARDFTLSATGNSRSFSLAAGSSATSLTGNTGAQPVTAGVQYSLSESGPAGYSPSAWTCTGTGVTQGTGADANKVTIALGGAGTCSITNDDQKATPDGTTVQSWILHDTMTITGIRAGAPDAATASVDFFLYSDDTCETLVGSELDQPITGGIAETEHGIEVSDSGFYYWIAVYSGDQYNEDDSTLCGDEITQILAKDASGDDFVTP